MRKPVACILALATALALSLPLTAWASSEDLTAAEMEDGSESFSLANWNTEQDGKTKLSNSVSISLDEGAQSLADAGSLTYSVNVWGSCDECRDMDLQGSVAFIDSNGNTISEWKDSYSEYDTWRQQHSLSSAGIVPAGTVRIDTLVENSVGTKSDLELTGTLLISSSGFDSTNGNNATYTIDSFAGTGKTKYDEVTGLIMTNREVSANVGRAAELRSTLTIFFGADARKSIADDIAVYGFYADFTDVEGGHKLRAELDIRFYDARGEEIYDTAISLNDSDFGGYISYTDTSFVDFSSDGQYLPIPAKTAYVKLEGRATVGTLSDLSSYIRFFCYHDDTLDKDGYYIISSANDEALGGFVPLEDQELSFDEAEGLPHPGVEEAELEAEEAEKQAAASEVAINDAPVVTPALRLSSAYAFIQANYPDKLSSIDPNASISEEQVLTVLYVAKCLASGETGASLKQAGIEQLKANAISWANEAGLEDLYESGVDTPAETFGLIRTYLGL